jgi:hypothetical protein
MSQTLNQDYALYGGAIMTNMVNYWVDASNLRTIPDHQEVFLHPDEDVSLIVGNHYRQLEIFNANC